ncbi:MAG: hypoxanthine phosphoribosyltransferase [Bacteroidales bacterium]|nr:hypoxanthine phosphoribosyltransferase [Bacteroidales bacterium]
MIQVLDKKFVPLVNEAEIQREIKRVATEIKRDLGDKNPLFIGVLNGVFMFAADLMKEIDFPCEITFVKCSSYAGLISTGGVKTLIGIDRDLSDRHVVILEDIVDTGLTMKNMISILEQAHPASVRIATCTFKPDSLQCELHLDYVGLNVPSKFLVGYGLDYNGHGRNYRDIYVLAE